jgi:hypothetical protein
VGAGLHDALAEDLAGEPGDLGGGDENVRVENEPHSVRGA